MHDWIKGAPAGEPRFLERDLLCILPRANRKCCRCQIYMLDRSHSHLSQINQISQINT
jgi:hypothetical protein